MSAANKEAADACLRKAQAFEASNDFSNALRLYEKSQRLNPESSLAAEGVARLTASGAAASSSSSGESASSPSPSSSPIGQDSPRPNPELRQRGAAAAAAPSPSPTGGGRSSGSSDSAAPRSGGGGGGSSSGGGGGGRGGGSGESGLPYTPEDAALLRKLKAAKDHYEVMGVPRRAEQDAIKKAYRDLSRKCHPDKNQHPDAKAVFQKLGNAYACLSDPAKRADYDAYGDSSASGGGGGGGGGGGMGRGGHPFHHAEVDPEEIFRAFFGGGMPMGGIRFAGGPFGGQMHRARQQHQQHQQQRAQGGEGLGELLRYLPFLMFLFLSFSGMGFDSWGGSGGRQGAGPARTFYLSMSDCQSYSRSCVRHTLRYSEPRFESLGLKKNLDVFINQQDLHRLSFYPAQMFQEEVTAVRHARNTFQRECDSRRFCEKLSHFFPAVVRDAEGGAGGGGSDQSREGAGGGGGAPSGSESGL
jgi:hypothetical protein